MERQSPFSLKDPCGVWSFSLVTKKYLGRPTGYKVVKRYSLSSSVSNGRDSSSEAERCLRKSRLLGWHLGTWSWQSGWMFMRHNLHFMPCLVCPENRKLGFFREANNNKYGYGVTSAYIHCTYLLKFANKCHRELFSCKYIPEICVRPLLVIHCHFRYLSCKKKDN